MRLILGNGNILITECSNGEQCHILLEDGRGSGQVGEYCFEHKDRQVGVPIPEEDLNNATCTLSFNNPTSLGVLLEKVLVGMVSFKENGKTIGEEHLELALSIKELWEELTEKLKS